MNTYYSPFGGQVLLFSKMHFFFLKVAQKQNNWATVIVTSSLFKAVTGTKLSHYQKNVKFNPLFSFLLMLYTSSDSSYSLPKFQPLSFTGVHSSLACRWVWSPACGHKDFKLNLVAQRISCLTWPKPINRSTLFLPPN